MHAQTPITPDAPRLRFVFDDTALSFPLDAHVTLADIADRFDGLAPHHHGDLVAIDVTFAPAHRH
ncbi:hypothetical protein [Prosthecodimorpha staleyi]|uniref:Uncharacterized protein n=1 Tax=Prosthecodimorpha staleyi TaxID=2840188 RepID=A0A947GJX9_9HYPH|nr:hypothetical protein [Prosthecodimorpha staleyi]MBT9292684.1 hypothetical protein [Prosthecodimorpha staleyi]